MKLLTLTFLFCTTCLALKSQPNNLYNLPLDSASGKISFDSVFNVPDLTKDDIYSRCKEWIANYFKSAKDVINMDDKESGILKMKGASKPPNEKSIAFVTYDLYVYIKDKKYKCVFNNLEFLADGQSEKVAAEYPLLFTKEDASMEHFELRRPMSEMLKTLARDIFSSLNTSITSKSKSDF
jgi:hypothetical protein